MDFIFEALTNGLPAFSNGGNVHTPIEQPGIEWDNGNIVTFIAKYAGGQSTYKINVTLHDVTVNGTAYLHPSGITGSDLFNLLRTVFPKANSVIGTGNSGDSVDLSNYYTKSQINSLLANLTQA